MSRDKYDVDDIENNTVREDYSHDNDLRTFNFFGQPDPSLVVRLTWAWVPSTIDLLKPTISFKRKVLNPESKRVTHQNHS